MKIYRLDYLIEQMALQKGDSVSEIRTQLQAHMGIPRPRLIRLRRATTESPCDFPLDYMRKAAEFLGCKVQDLLNMPAIEMIK